MNRNFLFSEIYKFILIGITAAFVHLSILLLLVEQQHWQPLSANLVAFLLAYLVSYHGHKYWTFNQRTAKKHCYIKYFLVAVLGCCSSEGILFFLTTQMMVHYLPSVVIALIIVPPIIFTISRIWIFTHE